MDVISTLKAVFALTIVVGLILGLAYLLRRFAPALMAKMQALLLDPPRDMRGALAGWAAENGVELA